LSVSWTSLAQNLQARIKIDLDRPIGDIDPLLFGSFTEHLGRCIYGGIYDPASPKADSQGFRRDVLEATRKLGITLVRWPGGNFASGYHWMDGIGPQANRPRRKDLAWGATETNQVGTDEFLHFAAAAGTNPYLCVNLGTGSWDEARNWVEYCNAPTGLYYSDLRAKNGHPQPYGVTYWGLGNEIDGDWQMGHRNAEDYSKFALEAAKLMKWSDNRIRLIASGSSNYGADWINWNRTVLTNLRDQIDYISLHHYAGNSNKDHYQFMAATTRVENIIRTTENLIQEVRTKYHLEKPIYIAFDEYNVWYRTGAEQKLEERYNLQDALVVALYLNCFLRHANSVKIANMAQLVNVIAPMMVSEDSLWLQTIYYPLQLFASQCRGKSLDALVQCGTYDAGECKHVPYLDVSAAYDQQAGTLIINVVNRHLDKTIETTLVNQSGSWASPAELYEVNAPQVTDGNSRELQRVKTVSKRVDISGQGFRYSFPPHSFTMIRIKINP